MKNDFGGGFGQEKVGRDTVLTVDNVALDLPLASAATRSLAAMIDYSLVGTLAASLFTLGFLALLGLDFDLGLWAVALVILGALFVHWLYFGISEIAMDGQTLGKRTLGLRVVTREGGTPGAGALVLRTVLRDIDLVVGMLWLLLDPLCRRLGDFAAGTLVVHDHPSGGAERAGPILHRLPAGWGAQEAATLEALLQRGEELAQGRGETLARRVREHLQRTEPALLEGTEGMLSALTALRFVFQATDG